MKHKNDGLRHESEEYQRYADDRVELLETIHEIVAQEVDRRLKELMCSKERKNEKE